MYLYSHWALCLHWLYVLAICTTTCSDMWYTELLYKLTTLTPPQINFNEILQLITLLLFPSIYTYPFWHTFYEPQITLGYQSMEKNSHIHNTYRLSCCFLCHCSCIGVFLMIFCIFSNLYTCIKMDKRTRICTYPTVLFKLGCMFAMCCYHA